MTIAYLIGSPISGANRGGTNPPTRPVPTRTQFATADFACGSLAKSQNQVKSLTRAIGLGDE